MSLVEGIGDEVIYTIGIAAVVFILVLAWYSTSVSDHPIFRASVLVIERRPVNNLSNNNQQGNVINVITTNLPANDSFEEIPAVFTESVEQIQENIDQTEETQNESINVFSNGEINDASNESETQLRNRFDKSNGSRNEQEPNDESVSSTADRSQSQVHVDSITSDGNIRIRLVFLNDTQRLVEAKLEDRLGQFKQQHFSEELANHRVVRLIYNGQLLQRDQETLQFYGLFDNCVVHCHISSTVVPPVAQQHSTHSELDLSRLMLPLFGLILGLVWCCRMQYRHYFNAASTFALIGITGLFIVAVFSVFLTTRNRLQQTRT